MSIDVKNKLAKQIKKLYERVKILEDQKNEFQDKYNKSTSGSSVANNLFKQIKLRENEIKKIRNQILLLLDQYKKIKSQIDKDLLDEYNNLDIQNPNNGFPSPDLSPTRPNFPPPENVVPPPIPNFPPPNNPLPNLGFSETLKKPIKSIKSYSKSIKKNNICDQIFSIGLQTKKNKHFYPSEFPKLTRRKPFSVTYKMGGNKKLKSKKI